MTIHRAIQNKEEASGLVRQGLLASPSEVSVRKVVIVQMGKLRSIAVDIIETRDYEQNLVGLQLWMSHLKSFHLAVVW